MITITPTFTSKVYITDYDSMNRYQKETITSPDFLNELDILRDNGNNDTVTFTPALSRYSDAFFMTVTEKHGNHAQMTTSTPLDFSEEVPKFYSQLKRDLSNNTNCANVTGSIVKYLI